MDNVSRSRDMENKRKEKIQKKMLKIKHIVTEIENVFGDLISRLDIVKESISEHDSKSTGTSQAEMQRDKK